MSEDNSTTDSEREFEVYETDWLANSVAGYGYGYTQEQALLAMLASVGGFREGHKVEVSFIEHVGRARASPMGAEVENLITEEYLVFSSEELNELLSTAKEAKFGAERLLDEAEDASEYEADSDYEEA